MRLKHFEGDKKAFESMLESAEGNAKNTFEINFVSDLSQKYEEYGLEMHFSAKQWDIIQRIAQW